MKAYLLIALSFLSIQLLGQEKSQPLLHVSGEATISVKPTLAVITMTIRSSGATYAGTVEELTNRIDVLTEVLKGVKFKEQEIFTSNFAIDKNYVYVQGERKEKGFNGLQTLKVQFKQDKDRLVQVLTAAAGSNANPEIAVSFDLDAEQKKEVKDELIRQAVSDATAKAELIVAQANHQIVGIKEIRYGVEAPNNPGPVYANFRAESAIAADVSNFEAADLSFSDQVNIVFVIKGS